MFTLDPAALFEGGFAPVLVSVTAPGGPIAPPPAGGNLKRKDMGKAPGCLTLNGWVPVSCAKDIFQTRPQFNHIMNWGGNLGIRGGLPLGLMWLDNDQGEEFSQIVQRVLIKHGLDPLRRYVDHPKHHRDAFLLSLVDVIGPVEVQNGKCSFRKGVMQCEFGIRGSHQQAVAWGVHPGTNRPYVWNRNVVTPDDVPQVHVDDWKKIYAEIVAEIQAAGWTLESGPAQAPAQAPPNAQVSSFQTGTFSEVQFALSLIPNDPALSSKELALWLDNYKNYIDVSYMVAGALGNTGEGHRAWSAWAYQRQQTPSDHPDIVWRSVVRQQVHSGMAQLIQLVFKFGGGMKWAQHLFAGVPDIPDEPNDPGNQILKDLRDNWAFAYKPDVYVNLPRNFAINRTSFNSRWADRAPDLYLAVAGRGLKKNQHIPRASDLFDRIPGRKLVRNLTYAPGDPFLVPLGDGQQDANTWRPAPNGFVKGVTEAQIRHWLEHVEFVLGSVVERDRFLRWAAYQVQFPERKSNWHWLIMAPEGFGKDTMFSPVRRAVGENNFIDIGVFDLAGAFNYYAERKLVLVNETQQVNTASMNAHNLYTKMKRMLTAPPEEITVNRKNRQEFQVPNRHAFFMFSNEQNPIFLAEGSRRIHVIDRSKERVQVATYYDQVRAALEAGEEELAASYLRYYPLPADIDQEMHGVAPATPAKQALQNMNHDPLRDALEEVVEDARLGGEPSIANLLATTGDLIVLVKGRTGINATAHPVDRVLLHIDGVTPVKKDPNRITPGVAGARHKGKSVTKRLWRLGDRTADGRDLTQMSVHDLVLYYVNGTPPVKATVTNLVKAKFAQAPVDPIEEEV